MSVRTDVINLNVNVNGNAAQNSLNELKKTAFDLSKQVKDAKTDQDNLTKQFKLAEKAYNAAVKESGNYSDKTREAAEKMRVALEKSFSANQNFKNLSADLQDVDSKISVLRKDIGTAALSVKDLNSEIKKITSLRNSAVPLSKEFNDYDQQLQALVARHKELTSSVGNFKSFAVSSYDSIKQNVSTLVASYLGFQAVVNTFQRVISGSIKLTDQLSDLQRISGLTADEANNLNHALLKIDTRTSGQGLLSIAIVAGKLGVAKDDIFSFTRAVDQLVVALGDELGNADQITTQLGKILNVFDGKITGDNISKLGNAIVDLANKGVATGGFLVDFTQRVSGIAKASNLSLASVLGLGAGLEENGARVESAGTAIQKLITTIGADVPKAAKVAGQDVNSFTKLLQKSHRKRCLLLQQVCKKTKPHLQI